VRGSARARRGAPGALARPVDERDLGRDTSDYRIPFGHQVQDAEAHARNEGAHARPYSLEACEVGDPITALPSRMALSAVRNPYIKADIERTRTLLYAA